MFLANKLKISMQKSFDIDKHIKHKGKKITDTIQIKIK